MKSNVSVNLAVLFMHHAESKDLQTVNLRIGLYCRHVDDQFLLMDLAKIKMKQKTVKNLFN